MSEAATTDDLSALAWVHDELRRSLDAAHKALRRYVRETDAATAADLDAVDPAVLRTARTQIHQGVGALELIGQPAAARVLAASEALVQRCVARPQKLTAAVVDDLERASFALLDYLGRLLAGRAVSPLALFPRYRAVLEAAGADRVHPADLWNLDFDWRALPGDPAAEPIAPDAARQSDFESDLLGLMRATDPKPAAGRLAALCAGLGAAASPAEEATLWKLASGMFEAQAHGLVGIDVFGKRVASRLLAHYRAFARGEREPQDRLAQDLLFFCAQSAEPPDPASAPHLVAARSAYGLAQRAPADYTSAALGRFDPALVAQAKKRVVAAKDAWSGVAGGELHRLGGLTEQFALVGDSLRRLFPEGARFAERLERAAAAARQAAVPPPAALAMEVATGLLYVEAALDEVDFDAPEQADRVARLAERLDDALAGRPAEALEGWMEELYRRVSDRQTMGSVVQELRTTLGEAEAALDRFFRDPSQRGALHAVPDQLASMRGVLSVLGVEPAVAALARMRHEVDALARPAMPNSDPDAPPVGEAVVFDRIAGNLGALGFLIDMLGVQPQLAKTAFEFDADAGTLRPVLDLAPRPAAGFGGTAPLLPVPEALPSPQANPVDPGLIEQAQWLAYSSVRPDVSTTEVARDLDRLSADARAADQPELASTASRAREALGQANASAADTAAVRGALSEALVDFVVSTSEPIGLDDEFAGTAPAGVPASARATEISGSDSGPAVDAEMRDVFLEEAAEVLDEARAAHAELVHVPDDLRLQTTLRRAFHTLKGSSRMVGLHDFGEGAWIGEQVYNTQLAGQRAATPAVLEFTAWSLDYLGDWIDAIGRRDVAAGDHDAATVAAAARLAAEDDAGRDAAPAARLHRSQVADLEAAEPGASGLDGAAFETAGDSAAGFDRVDRGASDREVSDRGFVVAEPAGSPSPSLSSMLPFDLPSAADLDLGGPSTTAPDGEDAPPATDRELSGFDLDLSALDDAPAFAATPRQAPTFDAPLAASYRSPADAAAEQAGDPFDALREARDALAPTEPIPLPEAIESGWDDAIAGPVDLPIDLELDFGPAGAQSPSPAVEAVAATHDAVGAPVADGPADLASEAFRSVGPLKIGNALFEIYIGEAEELSRRLAAEIADWAQEPHRPVGAIPVALAHSLAGNSATVGFGELSDLARALEQALSRSHAAGTGTPDDASLFADAAETIRGLLRQFAAGFLNAPPAGLVERLNAHRDPRAAANGAAVEPAVDDAATAAVEATPPFEPDGRAAPDATGPTIGTEPEPEPEPAATAGAGAGAGAGADVDTEADADAGFDGAGASVAADAHAAEAVATAASPPASPAGYDPLGVAALRPLVDRVPEAPRAAAASGTVDPDEAIDASDAVDLDLFPFFAEEAEELLPQLAVRLREWARRPGDAALPAACMRTLHTLKGGARLAGAMRLGELAHRLETRIEQLSTTEPVHRGDVEALLVHSDRLAQTFQSLCEGGGEAAPGPAVDADRADAASGRTGPSDFAPLPLLSASAGAPAAGSRPMPFDADPGPSTGIGRGGEGDHDLGSDAGPGAVPASIDPADSPVATADAGDGGPAPTGPDPIDWSRFGAASAEDAAPRRAAERPAGVQSAVRVRAPLLDRLVNQAGEVSISRSRIEGSVDQMRSSLGDLTENLERLRAQLRDIEFQGETQMSSRLEAAKAASQAFDPLEFDRFTRFQELARMMAESVNDVATVQRALQRSIEVAEDELAAQARMTRELQDELLRTRMVEFEGLSDRLYRVVRQTAKESGKAVRLDIVGGGVEVDRGVLDRMTGTFEHLLRNAVVHGIEPAEVRAAAGKEPTGSIVVALTHDGNEVGVEFRDDGAGLDLPRIRAKAIALGLLDPALDAGDTELANLIFEPGFTTADAVTELAGRGVGMDVVRSDVNAMGGRIETATAPGQGTSFRLILPLTTAVTQVVMVRCGETTVALPSTLVESVRRATPVETEAADATGSITVGDRMLQFFWLGALLQTSPRSTEDDTARTRSVVVVRSAQQRIAVQVDEVLGNREVVVKNLGPQLSRLPGLAGVSLLASGEIALIYNPVALAALHGDAARAASRRDASRGPETPKSPGAGAAGEGPLVMVVDDSLTVRRVTQRLLLREGYRVLLAKDGLDALEQLATARPAVVLSDIEMPRMDGFDLVRNLRSQSRLRDLPVIMITSRIAQKHRDYATELGVDHYLGKPYAEEDLLGLIARYTGERASVFG